MARPVTPIILVLLALIFVWAAGCAGPRLTEISLQAFDPPEWTAQGPVDRYAAGDLFNPLGAPAEDLMGFAILDAQRRYYRGAAGEIVVFLFRFVEPAEAYGAWTLLRPAGGETASYDVPAVADETVLAAWKGTYALTISAEGSAPLQIEAAARLAEHLLLRYDGTTDPPGLMMAFPKRRRSPRSEMYFHVRRPLDRVFPIAEDPFLLGGPRQGAARAKDPTAVFAAYMGEDRNEVSILLVRHPDRARAEEARASAEAYFATGGG
ncbi:MAG: hypothetical protein JXP34_27705, partial [Planctomycetes bacterium]|nr:hypothetical protein [Planctomycetota bacterium]